MNLPGADAQPGALPLTNHVIECLIRGERNLAEIERALDEVNHEVDFLLYPDVDRTPEFHDPFTPRGTTTSKGSWPSLVHTPHQFPPTPTSPSQTLIQDGLLDFEECNMLGACLHPVTSNP